VAASDATVLILGETGTGKDLIARAIHELSDRQQNKFVNLNCASIPTGLLESELFGHEKGAFTGAVSRKMGRMELADGGTLFLDEIGEVPLDIQPKLLRALQDREFERLGGTNTISVNVRMIVATNRHLADRVAKKLFRADLYYRINVFPIHLPALRERPADIPLLVRHFVEKAAIRLKRNPPEISPQVLDALNEWHWPGNVRELENFIERSILLSPGTILQSPIGELRTFQAHPRQAKSNENGTLEAVQRDRILRALRETRGVVAGSKGAAVRLAVKRSTLQSRIRKLGIKAEDYLS
jgi:formate hydrogenlyase transcriptional activator